MGFFEFVFQSLCLIFGFVLLLQVLKNRGERRTLRPGAAPDDRELQALRARVEALEAIVTDRRTQLSHEIDALEREPRRSGAGGY